MSRFQMRTRVGTTRVSQGHTVLQFCATMLRDGGKNGRRAEAGVAVPRQRAQLAWLARYRGHCVNVHGASVCRHVPTSALTSALTASMILGYKSRAASFSARCCTCHVVDSCDDCCCEYFIQNGFFQTLVLIRMYHLGQKKYSYTY